MEYANIRILNLPKRYKADEKKINNEIKNYKKNSKLSTITVDNNYNIIENGESYLAGKKLGLKYLESARVKTEYNPKSKFPSAFLIELLTACNLKCKMCPRNHLQRPESKMDINIFMKLIDEIANHKIDGIWLFNLGESLIHPQFFNMLDYLGKHKGDYSVWLSSNGVLLNEKNSKLLLNSCLDYLNISLNALDEESHKIVSRMPNFNLIMNNLSNIIKMKEKMKKRKPFIRVQIIDMPDVHDKIEKFKNEWGPKADIISINKLESFSGQKGIPTNKNLKDEKLSGVCKRIERGIMYIFSDNQVGICATDYNHVNNVGNVSKQSISDIWNSKKYRQLYDDIKNQRYDKVPFCYTCRDRELA
jgi:MoaA/NifB/PqqE/SkfB family radical SAM enzyme